MTTRPRLTDLKAAARIAREEGVLVAVERGGTVFRIAPPGVSMPMGATEREKDECDRAFGVGSS